MTEDYYDFDIYDIPEAGIVLDSNDILKENIVVIYAEDYTVHQALFEKIFTATGLNLTEDLGIIQIEKGQHVNLGRAVSEKTKRLISFGIAPANLGINAKFRAYRLYQTESFAILLSHSLKKLTESKEHKKALWEALKSIYKPA